MSFEPRREEPAGKFGPKCPACLMSTMERDDYRGLGLDGATPTTQQPLPMYRCPDCGWWVPCNRHGAIPPAPAQQFLPLELVTNRMIAKASVKAGVPSAPQRNAGVDMLGNCNRCGQRVEGTNAVCLNCNGAVP